MSTVTTFGSPHDGAMISPYRRNRVLIRPLDATELAMRAAINVAEQRVREAIHAIRAAAALPEGHEAIALLDSFETDARWLIGAYLAPARSEIEGLPGVEAEREEDEGDV